MIISSLTRFKSPIQENMPSVISPCGSLVITDFWIKRQASDFLSHIKFEAFQYMIYIACFIQSLSSLLGDNIVERTGIVAKVSTSEIDIVIKVGLWASMVFNFAVVILITKYLMDYSTIKQDEKQGKIKLPSLRTPVFMALFAVIVLSCLTFEGCLVHASVLNSSIMADKTLRNIWLII